MRQLSTVALLAVLAFSEGALANAELAAAKQCMQCHKVKEDFAGPSFHKIAASLKGKRDAESRMMATIRRGTDGSGGPHWGAAKMPDTSERPLVSPAEARQLARWILTQ
ncbi:c-type cytochrome [Caenimonas sp. SL110]|uniref:c-type cytochrome n=1 Tax=Caenimonas sp. SL110 TaxID=1450524 RepID=UPI00065404A7|nr:c-type cytochrome [Caenimonas sp. SL110]